MGRGWTQRRGVVGRATHWIAASALLLCSAAAFARDATPVRPGARVFGELAAGGDLTIDVLGVEGMRLDVVCAPFRGDDLVPQFALADPDGAAVDLAGHVVVAKHGATTRLRALVLAKSGTYHLTVSASSGSGGFDLVTTGKRATRIAGHGAAGAATLSFVALDGDAATLTMRTAGRKRAENVVVRYVDAAGTATPIAHAPPVKQTLTATGTHGFDVTAGLPFGWRVTLRPAKVDRKWLDAADLVAEASISGTILVGDAGGSAPPSPAAKAARHGRQRVVPGDVIVAFAPGKAPADASGPVRETLLGRECEVVHAMTPSGPFLVRVRHLAAPTEDERQALRTRAVVRGVARRGGVAWAECNDIVTIDTIPNDTLWPEQDTMRQIRMPDAWALLKSRDVDGSGVTVAFVDNGISPHPDVDAAILPGFDFADPNGWDSDPTNTTDFDHGLLIAGILGAVPDNRLGIAGIIPHARLVPVRSVFGMAGSMFDFALGIRWAAGLPVVGAPLNANPARVISCSVGGPTHDGILQVAVQDVLATGAMIVASAGNMGNSKPMYPASYAGVVSVGALTPDLTVAAYSTFGNWVTMWAPGTVLTTKRVAYRLTPTYEFDSGTSLAAPQVAGVAALMFALHPELTRDEVILMLQTSAAYIGGPPMLDAAKALRLAAGIPSEQPIVAALPSRIVVGRTATHAKLFLDNSGTGEISLLLPVMQDERSAVPWLSASLDGEVPRKLPVTVDVAIDQSLLGPGVFDAALRVVTDAGSVDVPVRVVRTPEPHMEFVRVRALRLDGSIAATAVASSAEGWHYTIPGLRGGPYTLVAETDADGTLQVDRVDEWSGTWPVPGEAGVVDVAAGADVQGYDFGMVRMDSRFLLSGVAGGSIRGAIAVRATNAVTRDVVPGARVYVGDGVYAGITDASGRAVLTGDFVAGQTVTVIADGYSPRTRIGFNGQFQAFALTPDTAATAKVTVVVDGLASGDATVDVALGNDWQRVVHDGSGTVSAEFTVTQRPLATPVVAVARDAGGVPTRSAFAPMDATLGATVVSLPLHAVGLPAPPPQTSVVVHQPDAAFDATAASTKAGVNALWSADDAPRIGGGEDPAGASLTVRWASPPGLSPDLAASIRVIATDAAGRMSSTTIPGTLGAIDVTSHLYLPAPPALVSPLDASSAPSVSLTLKFNPTLDSQFQWITLRDVQTGGVWEIDARATIRGVVPVVLPSIAERPIVPGHTFVWTVRSVSAPGVSADFYLDEERAAKTTDVCESAPRSFTTK